MKNDREKFKNKDMGVPRGGMMGNLIFLTII